MDTKKLYLKRNITKKSYSYFKNNLHKYLTPAEQNKIVGKNDLHYYANKYPTPPIKFKSSITIHKKNVATFMKKILKYYVTKDSIDLYDLKIHKYFNKEDNYPNYYIMHNCVKTNVLNVNSLSHKFKYFNMSNYQLNPSNTHMLFGVDFIGNRIFHLFIKSLYSNEIKEIKIPAQPLININNIYGSNLSDYFIWINDDEIAYVSQNTYYNQGGIYVYNILNKSKYLIKKIPHGCFGNINITTDNNYIVVYLTTYSSDSIYVMDNDDSKIKLLKKPLIDFKDNVTYTSIDHLDGEWIICEKNNQHDYIKKTNDFKHFTILYSNDNPYETILKMIYLEKKFIFTLAHLKGVSLYELSSCKKLTLLHNELEGYINIKNKYTTLSNFKYSIYHYLLKPQYFGLHHKCECNRPKYYEKKIYIKCDLYFTVLSKSKPHLSKCILWGYGSYNVYEKPKYTPFFVALIEEGYTVIIANVRGGGNYGYKGYVDGRLFNKLNTFNDFITIADYIVDHQITTRKKLAIWGRSAGGLLIATVINMRPDLCELAILGVPFIKVIETLQSYKTPLGIESRNEFGNVTKLDMVDYIKTYSPLDNIKKDGIYPNIFIYTNAYDTLVPCAQPIEYYNTMKEVDVFKNKERDINILFDKRFGHNQGSSKKDKVETFSIIFDQIQRYIY